MRYVRRNYLLRVPLYPSFDVLNAHQEELHQSLCHLSCWCNSSCGCPNSKRLRDQAQILPGIAQS